MSSQFDEIVEKATSELNDTEDYQTIFDICDKIQAIPNGPKEALKSITIRLNSSVPLHVMHALTLLDCCVKNCGPKFHCEVFSRDFEYEIQKLLQKGPAQCVGKMKEMLKRWIKEELKNDPQLRLKAENKLSDISQQGRKDSLTQESIKKEEDDLIAKAIELSLKESKATGSSSLYPNASGSNVVAKSAKVKEERKVRALYDFIAAEENELTFKAGEIIHVIDDRDPLWFLGSNQNGEGLFPANFVTSDLSEPIEPPSKIEKNVKFNEEVKVLTVEREEVVIDEEKIDSLLTAFLDADPTGEVPDSEELPALEDHCLAMGPLIEQQLEKIDHQHAELTQCNRLLIDALKFYETSMKSYPSNQYVNYQVQPEVYSNLQPQTGGPQQPIHVPTGHEYYQFPPLSGVQPTILQSQNVQSTPPHSQLPFDSSNLNMYGTNPHYFIPVSSTNNYSEPQPSIDANGLPVYIK